MTHRDIDTSIHHPQTRTRRSSSWFPQLSTFAIGRTRKAMALLGWSSTDCARVRSAPPGDRLAIQASIHCTKYREFQRHHRQAATCIDAANSAGVRCPYCWLQLQRCICKSMNMYKVRRRSDIGRSLDLIWSTW